MANYKETTVSGESYIRCNEIFIFNGLQNKHITFREQELLTLGDKQITEWAGEVGESFSPENASTAFPLLDPETGEPLVDGATMTYEGVYVALYSLYLHLAKARDELEA
jgi:hypothetical protein